jgi:hypothetical protein
VTAVEWTDEQRALLERVAGGQDRAPVDETERCCRNCGVVKPLDQFARSATSRNGRRRECKACTSAMTLTRAKARIRALGRLARAHPDEYDALRAEELAKLRADD